MHLMTHPTWLTRMGLELTTKVATGMSPWLVVVLQLLPLALVTGVVKQRKVTRVAPGNQRGPMSLMRCIFDF